MNLKKEKGVTLIELLVAMAILVILVGMIVPLFNSIGRVNIKQKELNRIDTSIGKSIDIIKREVRAARSVVVTASAVTATTSIESSKVIITKPDTTQLIFSLKNYVPTRNEKDKAGTSHIVRWLQVNNDPIHLANNISDLKFQFTNNIFTIYIKIVYKGNEKEIRDAVTSRIIN